MKFTSVQDLQSRVPILVTDFESPCVDTIKSQAERDNDAVLWNGQIFTWEIVLNHISFAFQLTETEKQRCAFRPLIHNRLVPLDSRFFVTKSGTELTSRQQFEYIEIDLDPLVKEHQVNPLYGLSVSQPLITGKGPSLVLQPHTKRDLEIPRHVKKQIWQAAKKTLRSPLPGKLFAERQVLLIVAMCFEELRGTAVDILSILKERDIQLWREDNLEFLSARCDKSRIKYLARCSNATNQAFPGLVSPAMCIYHTDGKCSIKTQEQRLARDLSAADWSDGAGDESCVFINETASSDRCFCPPFHRLRDGAIVKNKVNPWSGSSEFPILGTRLSKAHPLIAHSYAPSSRRDETPDQSIYFCLNQGVIHSSYCAICPSFTGADDHRHPGGCRVLWSEIGKIDGVQLLYRDSYEIDQNLGSRSANPLLASRNLILPPVLPSHIRYPENPDISIYDYLYQHEQYCRRCGPEASGEIALRCTSGCGTTVCDHCAGVDRSANTNRGYIYTYAWVCPSCEKPSEFQLQGSKANGAFFTKEKAFPLTQVDFANFVDRFEGWPENLRAYGFSNTSQLLESLQEPELVPSNLLQKRLEEFENAELAVIPDGLMRGIFVYSAEDQYVEVLLSSSSRRARSNNGSGSHGHRFDFVISYTREDIDFAVELQARLRRKGASSFLISAEENEGDALWPIRFAEALFYSRTYIPIVSEHYMWRETTRIEMAEAIAQGRVLRKTKLADDWMCPIVLESGFPSEKRGDTQIIETLRSCKHLIDQQEVSWADLLTQLVSMAGQRRTRDPDRDSGETPLDRSALSFPVDLHPAPVSLPGTPRAVSSSVRTLRNHLGSFASTYCSETILYHRLAAISHQAEACSDWRDVVYMLLQQQGALAGLTIAEAGEIANLIVQLDVDRACETVLTNCGQEILKKCADRRHSLLVSTNGVVGFHHSKIRDYLAGVRLHLEGGESEPRPSKDVISAAVHYAKKVNEPIRVEDWDEGNAFVEVDSDLDPQKLSVQLDAIAEQKQIEQLGPLRSMLLDPSLFGLLKVRILETIAILAPERFAMILGGECPLRLDDFEIPGFSHSMVSLLLKLDNANLLKARCDPVAAPSELLAISVAIAIVEPADKANLALIEGLLEEEIDSDQIRLAVHGLLQSVYDSPEVGDWLIDYLNRASPDFKTVLWGEAARHPEVCHRWCQICINDLPPELLEESHRDDFFKLIGKCDRRIAHLFLRHLAESENSPFPRAAVASPFPKPEMDPISVLASPPGQSEIELLLSQFCSPRDPRISLADFSTHRINIARILGAYQIESALPGFEAYFEFALYEYPVRVFSLPSSEAHKANYYYEIIFKEVVMACARIGTLEASNLVIDFIYRNQHSPGMENMISDAVEAMRYLPIPDNEAFQSLRHDWKYQRHSSPPWLHDLLPGDQSALLLTDLLREEPIDASKLEYLKHVSADNADQIIDLFSKLAKSTDDIAVCCAQVLAQSSRSKIKEAWLMVHGQVWYEEQRIEDMPSSDYPLPRSSEETVFSELLHRCPGTRARAGERLVQLLKQGASREKLFPAIVEILIYGPRQASCDLGRLLYEIDCSELIPALVEIALKGRTLEDGYRSNHELPFPTLSRCWFESEINEAGSRFINQDAENLLRLIAAKAILSQYSRRSCHALCAIAGSKEPGDKSKIIDAIKFSCEKLIELLDSENEADLHCIDLLSSL